MSLRLCKPTGRGHDVFHFFDMNPLFFLQLTLSFSTSVSDLIWNHMYEEYGINLETVFDAEDIAEAPSWVFAGKVNTQSLDPNTTF